MKANKIIGIILFFIGILSFAYLYQFPYCAGSIGVAIIDPCFFIKNSGMIFLSMPLVIIGLLMFLKKNK